MSKTLQLPELNDENAVQAIFLKGHLKMLATGMKNSRISGTQILRKAGAISGQTYKRGQYVIAADHLQQMINKRKGVA